MKTKAILFLSSLAAAMVLAVPVATAQSRSGSGHHIAAPGRGAPAMARSAPAITRSMGTFRPGGVNRWGDNWRHHRHFHDNDIIFFGDFGFPFYYPYGYYGYGYGYPYDGYYPYGYYDSSPYGYGYGYYNYNYRPTRYYSENGSLVAQVQRRLARAGYYHGAIDGVMGPRTRGAIVAYEQARNLRVDGRINSQLLSSMRLR